jgi:hypothetical protein
MADQLKYILIGQLLYFIPVNDNELLANSFTGYYMNRTIARHGTSSEESSSKTGGRIGNEQEARRSEGGGPPVCVARFRSTRRDRLEKGARG